MHFFDKTIHSRILLKGYLRLYYISFRLKEGAQGSYVHKVTTPMHYHVMDMRTRREMSSESQDPMY